MRISVLLLFIICSFTVYISAQVPVVVDHRNHSILQVREECPNMRAGNARLAVTTDGEQLVDTDDLTLCYGAGVIVNHNGDFMVDEDPDPATPAGVFYAVFTEAPTINEVIDGATLSGLDGILKIDDDHLIFAVADANGNMTIINDGSFLQAAGLEAPVQLWFAPVTIHNIEGENPEDYFEETDPCIHINSNSAFSILYLDELDFTIQQNGPTEGTITVSGGFPEWNDSPYSVTMTNMTTQGAVTLNAQNDSVFQYTISNTDHSYRITISDMVECSASRIINFRSGPPLEVHVPDTTTTEGSEICIPLTVKDFNTIGAFSFVMRWNPAILQYSSISYENPALSVDGNSLIENDDFKDQGNLIFFWFANNVIPIDIPNDSTLVEVCFTAIGSPGQSSPVTLGSYNGTNIDFSTDSDPVNFSIYDGSVTIVPSSDLDFSYSACASTTYELSVQVFGGRGPFSYSLTGDENASGSDLSDQFDITNLTEGSYNLEITDANGASISKDITISTPVNGNYGIGGMDNTCSLTDPNGYFFIDNPPAGNYQIEWTHNNETYYNVDTLYGIAEGEVSVVITDENNCPSAPLIRTVEYRGVRATSNVTSLPGCDASSPGKIEINVSGGTPDYTINYEGNTITVPNGVELDIYGQRSTFNIRDEAGCAITLVVNNDIDGGETFTLTTSEGDGTVDINCENEGDRRGEFVGNISTSSNTTNVNFSSAVLYHGDGNPVHGTKSMVNPLTGAILARFLDPGEYYWLIEGECSDTTFNFTIEDFAANPPSIDPTITAIGCGADGGLGAISIEVFPENGNYEYVWSNDETSNSISNLDAGEYTVTVTDLDTRCEIEETYTIREGIIYDKIETSIPCNVDTMVEVGVTIRDEFESILWDSGENTEIISVSSPGYYAFTITQTDPECSPIRDSIYIRSQAGGVQITSFQTSVLDNCTTQGFVFVTLSEPLADYGFSWDDGPIMEADNRFFVFDPDIHNLKIYKEDCVAIDTNFSIHFPNLITLDTSYFDVECFGENNGQINVTASGGSNDFRYEFNGSGREDIIGQYTNLAPGVYRVEVREQPLGTTSPCFFDLEFTISEPDPFTVAVDTTQVVEPSCTGESDGRLVLITSGGNPGQKSIRYTFSGGARQTTELSLDSLRASRYDIRIEDSLGCSANTMYILDEPEPVNFTIPPIEEPPCAGYTTPVTISSATGGTGSNYQFSIDGGVPVPLGESLDILAGEHEITVFDENLCNVTNVVTIREPDPIIVDFNQPDTLQVSLGEATSIAAQINGINPITDYIWTPAPPDSTNTENTINFTAVDNVTIHLEVVDSRGCTGTNNIFVLVRKKRDIGIPNAFTPNGDGHNDRLIVIPGPSVRSIQQFQVYDRYGTLMWEEKDISPGQAQITGWDGTYSGKPAMFDVYVAIVKVEYIDGQVIQRVSDVTLLK